MFCSPDPSCQLNNLKIDKFLDFTFYVGREKKDRLITSLKWFKRQSQL